MEANNQHIDPNELLVKYLAGEATADEKLQVENWIAAKPENQRHYEHFKQLWNESLQLADDNYVDENAAWERFKERTINENNTSTAPLNKYLWLKVAAAVLIGFGAMLFIKQILSNKENARFATATTHVKRKEVATIVVVADKVKKDTLPDGSIITQNKNSTLRYPAMFTSKTRNVQLTGEAFFNIKHDSKRPFIINVNNVKITVLGTSFNVKGNGKITEVVVETGLVSVQTQQQTVTLHPGQKLTANQPLMRCNIGPVPDNSYRNYVDVKTNLAAPKPDQKHDMVIKSDSPSFKKDPIK